MSKVENDKYYTPVNLSKKLIDITFNVVDKLGISITEVIEPSAGDGSFSSQILGCIAYDISPDNEHIIKQDFLTLDISYKKEGCSLGILHLDVETHYLLIFLSVALNLEM